MDYYSANDLVDSTARCLAVCVQAAPGDDAINSTIYTLMNASSQSSHLDGGGSPRQGNVSFALDPCQRLSTDTESIYGDDSDVARRSIAVNALAMIAKLALWIDRLDVSA
jgi:hypothetical protein